MFCGQGEPSEPETPALPKVVLVLDTGMEDDRTFNAHGLKGARAVAAEGGFELIVSPSSSQVYYERNIEAFVSQKPALILTMGFRMGDPTARVARRHPRQRFAVVDVAYLPGRGCAETVADCYTEEGGLANMTSLVFAEDQVGFLAGVLAGCMSKTGVVASVAGPEIQPVVDFATGFANGARHVNPDVKTHQVYLPGFNELELGRAKAHEFIDKGADVVFGIGGNSGNGALLACKERGVMGVGVDGDQYETFPEVREILLTSASKKIDQAMVILLRRLLAGNLAPGIIHADLANQGVGLAPFHEWEERIPGACKQRIQEANDLLIQNPKRALAE
ncbi:BMP family ABC transporter substrate-binding protein [Acanthopleuribacter pedis]|uniref:BMP family ABC transporter substrate-binding protein n=2 Tax=Acanthopleuribacter pedis TaxID=442870 RepID=A0A8J7Q8N6_9BACT|nr:BMP family ABC transporter substrate-binding protein [Acanthopleuribacter pedis]